MKINWNKNKNEKENKKKLSLLSVILTPTLYKEISRSRRKGMWYWIRRENTKQKVHKTNEQQHLCVVPTVCHIVIISDNQGEVRRWEFLVRS